MSPTTYQYNLGVQYQIGSSTAVDVAYVGNHGIHLGRNRNINQVPDSVRFGIANFEAFGAFDATSNPGGCVPDNTTCIADSPDTFRPFLGYNVINYNERTGVSRYNSLQIGVNHRLSYGLQMQASYTHSRNISNTANQDTEAGFAPIQNAFDANSEKALANQDTPNSLSVNYIWDLPFFSSSHGITARRCMDGKSSAFLRGVPEPRSTFA